MWSQKESTSIIGLRVCLPPLCEQTMTEDRLKADPSKREGLDSVEGDTEPSLLLQKLKSNISKNVQGKVDVILQDVQRFSDNDKLYLYLQLPSGPSSGEKSLAMAPLAQLRRWCISASMSALEERTLPSSSSDPSSFNTADQLHTCNWIRSHLEEHVDTCLPKQDVYETYKRYCENLQHRPLSAANFGKIIRDIFPNIKARRLGGRGQSKYCYSGIRRKTVLNMPLLPNLDLKNDPSELTELVQTYKQEVTEAACELICDWAQKILKRSFDTVVEIARFLVQEHIVNPRCSQAELVTSAAMAGGPAKPHKVIKKNPVPSKGGGPETEGSGSEAKRDKDVGDQSLPGKLQSSDKPMKGAESVRPGGRELQVEALMKHLPRILPRSSVPEKSQLSVRSSPPSLAPKDAGGMKVITMTALPQQQGGALPVMILPQSVSLSYPDREKAPSITMAPVAPTSVVQRARAAGKRAPEAASGGPGPGGTPAKRKRGRPRKPRPEDTTPPQPPPPPLPSVNQAPIMNSLTGGVIQKACSSSSSQVVEVVFQDQQALVLGQLHSVADTGDPEHRGMVLETDPRPVLLLSGASHTNWDMGRAMVEVIQRAPRPPTIITKNNNSQSTPQHRLPLPTVLEDRGEVEITLTPVEPSDDLPTPTGQASSTPTAQASSEGGPTPDDSSKEPSPGLPCPRD
ncbi:DNA-binding protein RFX5 isoform X2 [Oncorhynchus kisutch]|uniref:DNA-binding protein RFX5 isoform X2 n=1 Tax=Oncorhynchus kisutch TaxID=8019 RepID=UPI00099FB8DC|nr:DNA-binding protein RFX5 isoform X2 [Oncorhynchus kisutch]